MGRPGETMPPPTDCGAVMLVAMVRGTVRDEALGISVEGRAGMEDMVPLDLFEDTDGPRCLGQFASWRLRIGLSSSYWAGWAAAGGTEGATLDLATLGLRGREKFSTMTGGCSSPMRRLDERESSPLEEVRTGV